MSRPIDPRAFEAAFREALPEARDKFREKAENARASGLPLLGELDDLSDSFCDAWPKAQGFLGMAIRMLGWAYPSQAGIARAIMAAVERTIVPALCDAEADTAKAGPEPYRTNFNQPSARR
jgi:hypothetical protein